MSHRFSTPTLKKKSAQLVNVEEHVEGSAKSEAHRRRLIDDYVELISDQSGSRARQVDAAARHQNSRRWPILKRLAARAGEMIPWRGVFLTKEEAGAEAASDIR